MNPFIDNTIRMVGGYRVMHYLPTNADEIVEQFRLRKIDGISVHSESRLVKRSLEFLYNINGLKAIFLQQQSDLALDVLYDMPQLEYLSTDETKQTLDLGRLKNLTKLSIDWHKKLFKNADLSNLKVLALSKYKPATKDFTDFPQFNHLQRLVLTQGTITSLNGISRFTELNDLALHYLPKLEHLDELDLPELEKFRVEHCKRLSGYEQLAVCTNLEDLKINACGSIQSVQFIKNLKKMKTFRFIDTEVIDGDLSPLLGLDDVYFTQKKHYSHKTGNFRQLA